MPENGEIKLEVLENDNLPDNEDVKIEILNQPDKGKVSPPTRKNKLKYVLEQEVSFGETFFTYKVCLEACPESCSTAEVRIRFESTCLSEAEANIPNAFSPNGDSFNDKFEVFPNAHAQIVGMKIFDRWGGQGFEGGEDQFWDGTWQGNKMTPGVYVYLVELVLQNGDRVLEKGEVSLMR